MFMFHSAKTNDCRCTVEDVSRCVFNVSLTKFGLDNTIKEINKIIYQTYGYKIKKTKDVLFYKY